jgi:hypothetical protein
MVHYAVGQARPGDILVIDRCGDEAIATIGGAVAYAARAAGVVGIVVDGLVTDLGELRAYGVPVWSRGHVRRHGEDAGPGRRVLRARDLRRRGRDPRRRDPGRRERHPGAAGRRHRACATRALQMMKDEKRTLARIDAGEKYPDIMGPPR